VTFLALLAGEALDLETVEVEEYVELPGDTSLEAGVGGAITEAALGTLRLIVALVLMSSKCASQAKPFPAVGVGAPPMWTLALPPGTIGALMGAP
jgi:hypothetical protein